MKRIGQRARALFLVICLSRSWGAAIPENLQHTIPNRQTLSAPSCLAQALTPASRFSGYRVLAASHEFFVFVRWPLAVVGGAGLFPWLFKDINWQIPEKIWLTLGYASFGVVMHMAEAHAEGWTRFWRHRRTNRSAYTGEIAELWQRVFTHPEFPKQGHILDVGTGSFAILKQVRHLVPEAQLHGIDIAELPHAQIPPGIHFEQQFIEQTRFPDAYFNAAVSMHGLEYSDWSLSLPELLRIMRPGAWGVFVIHSPNDFLVQGMSQFYAQHRVLEDLRLFDRMRFRLSNPGNPDSAGVDETDPLTLLYREIQNRKARREETRYLQWMWHELDDLVERARTVGGAWADYQEITSLHQLRVFRAEALNAVNAKLPGPDVVRLAFEQASFKVFAVDVFRSVIHGEVGWHVIVQKRRAPVRLNAPRLRTLNVAA